MKTTRNFKIALYYIDDNGERIFCSTYPSVAKAERDAKEILLANDMVGREYLVAFCDEDHYITNCLYYVRLVLNEEHEREFCLTAFSF